MINLHLAQVITEDRLRKVEKARLTEIAIRSRKEQTRQRLAQLACRLGMVQTC